MKTETKYKIIGFGLFLLTWSWFLIGILGTIYNWGDWWAWMILSLCIVSFIITAVIFAQWSDLKAKQKETWAERNKGWIDLTEKKILNKRK